MEAAVKMNFPVSVESARLVESAEGLGIGGVLVGEVRWHTEGSCNSGGKKDDIPAFNVSAPARWKKIPDSDALVEVCHPYSLHSADAMNDCASRKMKSHHPALDVDAKSLLKKSGKIGRKISGCTKRSGLVHMETSKNIFGLRDVNGNLPELASSSASCSVSEKNQLVKQKHSSSGRRGDKRNNKANYKSRSDTSSLKNGLVGLNSPTGGNNVIGLKSDVFDITKYVDEPSLGELLHGNYRCPFIKGKKTTNSNSNLLQSIRKACSVLQARKVSQPRNFAETDNSSFRKEINDSIAVSSALCQTDGPADLSSSGKVHKSDDKFKMSDIDSFQLYKARDILGRLSLSRSKDLDMLLSDASKTISSSKNISADSRTSKLISQRIGLPPFPWSHSSTGHTKLGYDAVKLSASRTVCQGPWIKVVNCTALQKGSADLLKDFESLTFDQNLVPSASNESAPVERVLSASDTSSPSTVTRDEYFTTHAAARTLLDIAAYSKQNPRTIVNLLKTRSMEAGKSKTTEISISKFIFQEPKSTIKPHDPSKIRDDGFSFKKPKLSTDLTNSYITTHTEPTRKVTLDPSPSSELPTRKSIWDPNANTDSYGINIVKKSCVIKTPRGTDRPTSSKPKFWKSSR